MKFDLKAGRQEYQELLEADRKFWADAEASGDDPTAEQVKEVKDRNKRIEELEHQISDALERDGIKTTNGQRRQDLNTPAPGGRLETPIPMASDGRSERKQRQPIMNFGAAILDDPGFKAWHEAVARNGAVSTARFGQSPRVDLKALITGVSDTSAGAMVSTLFRGMPDMANLYARELTVLDLVTTIPVSTDTISYARQGTFTNNAAPTAEATGSGNGTGAKPESEMAFTAVTDTVKTIPHWIAVTRRALADAPQLRGMINSFLTYGVREELEDQIITGDGSGENLTGVLNTSGTTAQAFDTDILTTTRKARTKVRVNGRANPTGYVMHPNDWEDFDLLQDNEARYYYGGPSILGNPRLWGLPVVECEGMTEGTAVVADWRLAVLYDREDVQILLSDSHQDFFIRNLVAVLAELRAGFGILRPSAFVEVDLTA